MELALVGEAVRRDGVWHAVYSDEAGNEVSEALPDVKGWKQANCELRRRRGDRAKGVTLHTLRHTYATHLLKQGVDVKTVSELLGHHSTKMTLDVYAHVFETDKHNAVAALPFGRDAVSPTFGGIIRAQPGSADSQLNAGQTLRAGTSRIAL